MKYFYTLLFTCLASCYLFSQHTFSIVAIDPETGAIGSAGATCLNTNDCPLCTAQIISDLVPGKGAVNAQATVCIPNSNLAYGIQQIESDNDATAVLNLLLANDQCTFGDTINRQYGIVTIDANDIIAVEGYTGTSTDSLTGHLTGPNYSIQGNILIDINVLDSMEAGFLKTDLTFPEKLMSALQGANRPGADSRCLSDGISSRSAYLRIAMPDDDPGNFSTDIHVPILDAGQEPIDEVQRLFDEAFPSSTLNVNDNKSFFTAYPNPTFNGQVTFEIKEFVSEGYDIVLMDNSGREVCREKVKVAKKVIDFSTYNLKGTYIFKIENGENEFLHVGKLIFF